MLGGARRPVQALVVSAWIGMLVLIVATSGRNGQSPLASKPIVSLIWALLLVAAGALLLAERAHYVGVYERGINRGPFRMGKAATSRLVTGTGFCLLLAGLFIGI